MAIETLHTFTGDEVIATELPNLLNENFTKVENNRLKTVNNVAQDDNNNINVTELIPKQITSDTNLNNVVTSGEYTFTKGSANITNSPTTNSFFLTVLRNDALVKQVVTEVVLDDPITYTRVLSGSSWSPWVEGGKVKTINSIKPDDSGNVDLSSMIESALVDYSFPNLIIANTPNYYKRPSLFTVSKTTVTIPKNTQVRVGDKGFQNLADVTLELSTAGDAATRKGKDVYIYACQPSTNTTEPVYVLSLNSTVPTGYTAETSRKIGGFHCLCASVGTISGHTLSGYVAGDILPLSKWDLLHRPVSAPGGMVWLEGISKWVDIYLPSWNGTGFVSAYGGVISDGASSPAFNGERFVEYAGLVGKRPCYRNEFMVFAKGSNEGTNIKGGADPNTTGGHVDTAGRRMVSNYGIEDCCGVMWQWGADLFENYSGSTWNSANFYLDGYAWQTKSVYNEACDSQSYGSCIGLLRRVLLGAYWDDGSGCGSRSAYCSYFSAYGWSNRSSRLVAEPMVVNL